MHLCLLGLGPDNGGEDAGPDTPGEDAAPDGGEDTAGDASEDGGGEDGGGEDVVADDFGLDLGGVDLGGADLGGTDLGGDSGGSEDLGGDAGGGDADVFEFEEPCLTAEGFGCECDFDFECASDLCVDLSFSDSVCTQTCATNADCRIEGWECGYVEDFLDIMRACVPVDPNRCETCSADRDCARGYFCGRVDGERRCVADCTFDSDCLPGTECVNAAASGFNTGCVPVTGSCIDCVDLDEDGYGVGPDCAEGEVDCRDDIFGINPGVAERCNEIDDDCDRETDEDFDLTSDGANCGACGTSCARSNVASSCFESECVYGACDGTFEDCDDDLDLNGCESDLSAPTACGVCDGLAGTPGTPCGTCGSGTWACDGIGAVTCEGDEGAEALNACGGCATLDGERDAPCGTCDTGSLACDGVDALTCVEDGGSAALNACGGCDSLPAELGDACEGLCGTGEWTCDGEETLTCVDDSANACGGCGTIAEEVGGPCGRCGLGTWSCVDDNSVECVDSELCDDLVIDGESVVLSGDIEVGDLIVTGGGTLSVAPFDGTAGEPGSGTPGSGTLRIFANSIRVDAGASIIATDAGGAGTSPGQSTTAALESDAAGGGGYGGRGGNGATNTLQGGEPFGTSDGEDISQGSNGGSTACRAGLACNICTAEAPRTVPGVGGGIIELYAATITINGSVISNGTGGSTSIVLQGSGGGSGGGILLRAISIDVAGTISADGGAGGPGNVVTTGPSTTCHGFGGGGGGGGRIKLIGLIINVSGSVHANGGAAGTAVSPGIPGKAGAAGTVFIQEE